MRDKKDWPPHDCKASMHGMAHGGSRQSTHNRTLLETLKTPWPMLSSARQAAAAHGHSRSKASAIGE
jgi:lambda repressor-like predicted transcriptional regulator